MESSGLIAHLGRLVYASYLGSSSWLAYKTSTKLVRGISHRTYGLDPVLCGLAARGRGHPQHFGEWWNNNGWLYTQRYAGIRRDACMIESIAEINEGMGRNWGE